MTRTLIDLRSDTVTKPSPAMRKAMLEAEVGDDVFGEDPTVNALQRRVADLFGKEDALFTPSGVMANQLAIKCLTQPGDEVIVERDSHIFNYETSAPSILSAIQLATVQGSAGVMTVGQIREALRPSAYFMPRSSLICLENTHNRAGGTLYPLEEIRRIHDMARDRGLSMHLDGARIWNAWIASTIHPREYASFFDTVSVCFSKGLGAPIGSALIGTGGTIAKARKFRKIFGGGMRQSGIIAAGALFALENNVQRLREDHEKAALLAEGLKSAKSLKVDHERVQTNIVMIELSGIGRTSAEFLARLRSRNLLLTEAGPTTIRAVTHLDVTPQQITQAVDILTSLDTA